jgi:DNA (cytosine-5)-methyltransferase 1
MIKILELFGGIGACSKALERIGIEYEIADYVEIDKYAVASFNAIHDTNYQPQDITQWDKDIDVDLIMHGSPCQDFSLAGKQAGGDKDSGTRSSLMYETIRIVEKLKPKYVIWENVKNLISKKHIHNFNAYIETLNELGYKSYYKVLNAKDYGIPQNRERVFTISIREDMNEDGLIMVDDFTFPPKQELKLKLKDMLEDNVDEKYYLSDIAINKIKKHKNKIIENENPNESSTIHAGYYKMGGRDQQYIKEPMIYDDRDKGIATTISTSAGNRPVDNFILTKDTENYIEWHEDGRLDVDCRAFKENKISGAIMTTPKNKVLLKQERGTVSKDSIHTITTRQDYGVVLEDLRIRKLTPKECWRLMGFDDEDFEKASKVNSNTQLYKQAGNSIVVNVLESILKNLI